MCLVMCCALFRLTFSLEPLSFVRIFAGDGDIKSCILNNIQASPSATPSLSPSPSSSPSTTPSSLPSLFPSATPSVSPSPSSAPSSFPTIPTTIEVETFEEYKLAIAESTEANGFGPENLRTIFIGGTDNLTDFNLTEELSYLESASPDQRALLPSFRGGFTVNLTDHVDLSNTFTAHVALQGFATFYTNGYKYYTPCVTGAPFSALFMGIRFVNTYVVPNITNTTNATVPTIIKPCNNADFGGAFHIEGVGSGGNTPIKLNYYYDRKGGPGAPSYLHLQRCTFRGYNAEVGGAIDIRRARLRVTGTKFVGNSSPFLGGAIFAAETRISMVASEFEDNSAGSIGGALDIRNSYTSINTFDDTCLPTCTGGRGVRASVFRNNQAGFRGGAISIFDRALFRVGDCGVGSCSTLLGSTGCKSPGARFESNSANEGGAIDAFDLESDTFYQSGRTSWIEGSSFQGNSAQRGGALRSYASSGIVYRFNIRNTLASSNTPESVRDDTDCFGGGGRVSLGCNNDLRCNSIAKSNKCKLECKIDRISGSTKCTREISPCPLCEEPFNPSQCTSPSF